MLKTDLSWQALCDDLGTNPVLAVTNRTMSGMENLVHAEGRTVTQLVHALVAFNTARQRVATEIADITRGRDAAIRVGYEVRSVAAATYSARSAFVEACDEEISTRRRAESRLNLLVAHVLEVLQGRDVIERAEGGE